MYEQVKSGNVTICLRKKEKRDWPFLTAREKKLKDAREYVIHDCSLHVQIFLYNTIFTNKLWNEVGMGVPKSTRTR